jgi:putative tryptophan/tyrosine transport system substrate-binding protein
VLLATPLPAEAQHAGKVPRIGLLFANTPQAEFTGPEPTSPYARAFLEGMRALGWIDGRNITIERRSAEGQPSRFAALVQELIGLHLDLLVTAAPFSVVQQAASRMPVVIAGADTDNLLQAGLVKSLAQPGGNVTGLTISPGPSIRGKRLQLLTEAVRNVSQVAYLGAPLALDPLPEAAARVLKLTLLPVEVATPDGLDNAFAAIRQKRVDAIFIGGAGFFWGHRLRIIEFAARQRLPAVYPYRIFAESGGLMSYGADYVDLYRRAATYADKILKGAKPGDLPVEQPTKFELVINLKTAKALGLTIPQAVLLRADELIQ